MARQKRQQQQTQPATPPPLPTPAFETELWDIDRPKDYPQNARNWTDDAVQKVAASIRQFGFVQPVVVDKEEVIIIGHLRRAAGRIVPLTQVPVHIARNLTPTQVRQLRLIDNRSHEEATWDATALSKELADLKAIGGDLSLTGFNTSELDDLLGPVPGMTDADAVPPAPVTDPPYGIELDSEWRDRAGLNGHDKAGKPWAAEPSYMKQRTEGHTETKISGDTRADWSEAFELVPSLEVAYVWHASVYTREVLEGLLRIGFKYPQQIIWNKGRTVLTRTDYWYQHEPCWYVRKPNAPWYGVPGDNSTIWEAPSPKFMMGASKETKFDHPTQKPVALLDRPIINHTKPGEIVYDPFLGSGSTLIAAQMRGRTCYGNELEPRYVDVIVERWQNFTGGEATLEAIGETYETVKVMRVLNG